MPSKDSYRRRRRGSAARAGVVAFAVALALSAGLAVANANDTAPPTSRAGAKAIAAAKALASPGLADANDFDCVADPAEPEDAGKPEPVILVHDTFRDGASNFKLLAPEIAATGLCVFALDYGHNATAPLADSAHQLHTFLTGVLAATGADKADLVGHGQGGVLPRQLVGPLGLADKVDDIVAIAPATRGTDTPLADEDFPDCAACTDLEPDSAFLTELNADGDVVPGPDYTVPWSVLDDVITPSNSQTLKGGDEGQVNNERMEFACLFRFFGHDLDEEPAVADVVLSALQRDGPSDPDNGFRPARC